MSTEEKQIDAYLIDIQKKFLEKEIHDTTQKGLSWGQFLDGPAIGQVGLYGTVSAAITLKTKTNSSHEATKAENELIAYWDKRHEQEQHDNLCQNIRLAALLLGLCFNSDKYSDKVSEISIELQNRLSTDELWSDSSKPTPGPQKHDFSSSIVIVFAYVSIKLYKGDRKIFGDLPEKLETAARALQKLYIDDPKRERTYLPVLLIAVLLVHGKNAHATVQRGFSKYATNPESIFNRNWHHLDFINQNHEYKRDYFILPHRLLVPLLLLQPDIKGVHFLFAQAVLIEIKETLDTNGFKLFQEADGRPSSLEQALAALALYASRNVNQNEWILIGPRCLMFRGSEMLFAWMLILFIYLPVGIILSAEWLHEIPYLEHWTFGSDILAFAKTVPGWVPTIIITFICALREPKKMINSALGKENEK